MTWNIRRGKPQPFDDYLLTPDHNSADNSKLSQPLRRNNSAKESSQDSSQVSDRNSLP